MIEDVPVIWAQITGFISLQIHLTSRPLANVPSKHLQAKDIVTSYAQIFRVPKYAYDEIFLYRYFEVEWH